MHYIRVNFRCNTREKFTLISHSLFQSETALWQHTMKLLLVASCLLVVVYCQTQHKNGNPTGEIGQPAFDEIIVESTLTVRGKSGSRSGKSLVTESKPKEAVAENIEAVNGASVSLNRNKREPRQSFGGFAHQNLGVFPSGSFGNRFPSSSSSAAHASSNAFNSNTPFGSFGASASQSSSQSQNFGPSGFQGSTGQSASQTYYLPNGSRIDLSFSNSFVINNGRPSSSNSHSFTVTGPNGKVKQKIM